MKLSIRRFKRAGKKGRRLLKSGEGLEQRTIRSAVWAAFQRMSGRLLMLIKLTIVLSFITQADYLLFAAVLTAKLGVEYLTQMGIETALIRMKDRTEEYLDVAWTLRILRGIVMFLGLFFAAPYIADLLNAGAATLMIRVVAVTFLLNGLDNIGVVYFRKNLNFNKQAMYELSRNLTDVAVATILVIIFRDVWAFVWGALAAAGVRLIMSYVLQSYRPRLSWNQERVRELWRYGRWIMASSVLMYLATWVDRLVVGVKLRSEEVYDEYLFGSRYGMLIASEVTQVVSGVTFPAYSRVQDNLWKMREGYLKALQLTALLSFPLAAGLCVLGPEGVAAWKNSLVPMVPVLQIMALCGAVRSIRGTTQPVFLAVGKPYIATMLDLLAIVLVSMLVYPFIVTWGIEGAACAALIASIITSTIAFLLVLTKGLDGAGVFHYARMGLLIPLISAGAMALVLNLVAAEGASWPEIALKIVGGAALYFALVYVLDRLLGTGIIDNLKAAAKKGLE
jgi:O-antigen/teichoic acid export membrane protein